MIHLKNSKTNVISLPQKNTQNSNKEKTFIEHQ